MRAMSVVGLLTDAQHSALTVLASLFDQNFEGLSVAARAARRAGRISPGLAKKLERLDLAAHFARHATAQKVRILADALDAELRQTDKGTSVVAGVPGGEGVLHGVPAQPEQHVDDTFSVVAVPPQPETSVPAAAGVDLDDSDDGRDQGKGVVLAMGEDATDAVLGSLCAGEEADKAAGPRTFFIGDSDSEVLCGTQSEVAYITDGISYGDRMRLCTASWDAALSLDLTPVLASACWLPWASWLPRSEGLSFLFVNHDELRRVDLIVEAAEQVERDMMALAAVDDGEAAAATQLQSWIKGHISRKAVNHFARVRDEKSQTRRLRYLRTVSRVSMWARLVPPVQQLFCDELLAG